VKSVLGYIQARQQWRTPEAGCLLTSNPSYKFNWSTRKSWSREPNRVRYFLPSSRSRMHVNRAAERPLCAWLIAMSGCELLGHSLKTDGHAFRRLGGR
jgi:hypothetical protein